MVAGFGSAGLMVTPEATACVHAYVASDPAAASSVMAAGTEQYGLLLVQACPQLAG